MEYIIITDKEQFDHVVSQARAEPVLAFDFECSSLETHSDDIRLVGLGLCWKAGTAYYIPFNDPSLEEGYIIDQIRPIFEDDTVGKIGHNVKFDSRLLNRFGINISNILFDTMVASYCLYGDRTNHNLDDLVLHHLGYVKIRTKNVIPKKTKTNPNPTMLDVSISEVGLYCCEDVDYTFRLYELFTKMFQMSCNSHCKNIFYDIDMPLVSILLRMECTGVRLDEKKLEALRKELSEDLEKLQLDINEAAGREVGLTKPTDISSLLYDELKVHKKLALEPKKTPGGALSTDAATLQRYADHPVVQKILDYKTLAKLISTYVVALPQYISKHTGFLHPFFNQTRTSTGRLASSDPNVQNIPQRNPIGKKVREAFISRWDGGKILAADYSQCELRILAHASGEPVFVKAYNNDEDIHLAIAADVVYNKPKEEVQPGERTVVKTLNFGLLYGMRAKKLAATLGITVVEADNIINKYMSRMHSLRKFLEDSRTTAKSIGYTETLFGRRRYVPKIYSRDLVEQWAAEREAANHIIQGTNADIIKIAMIRIQEMLDNRNLISCMILQVHDEVVLDVHPDEIDIVLPEVTRIMENVVNYKVVMKAEGKYADNWGDAH